MARSSWQAGNFEAAIYEQVLLKLGYDVSSPAMNEVDAERAYLDLAEGSIDVYPNSWYPGHFSAWEFPTADGTRAADNLVLVPGLLEDAAVEGYMVTKSVADEFGITSVQQINDDPTLVELFDQDLNGKAEIFGCSVGSRCDEIMENQIAFYGWESVERVSSWYDNTFDQAADLVDAGEPMLLYAWAPSSYIARLVPGEDVYWLSAHPTDVLDDSNPAGIPGGEAHDQLGGIARVAAGTCIPPCQLGWTADSKQVTANADWAADNPEAIAIMSEIGLSVLEISRAELEQAEDYLGLDKEIVARLAEQWMATNQDQLNQWIAIGLAKVESGEAQSAFLDYQSSIPVERTDPEVPQAVATALELLDSVECRETPLIEPGEEVWLAPAWAPGVTRFYTGLAYGASESPTTTHFTLRVLTENEQTWTIEWEIDVPSEFLPRDLESLGIRAEDEEAFLARFAEMGRLSFAYELGFDGQVVGATDQQQMLATFRQFWLGAADVFEEFGSPQEAQGFRAAAEFIDGPGLAESLLEDPRKLHFFDGLIYEAGVAVGASVDAANSLTEEPLVVERTEVLAPEFSAGGCAVVTSDVVVDRDAVIEQTVTLMEGMGLEMTEADLADIENLVLDQSSQTIVAWDLAGGWPRAIYSGAQAGVESGTTGELFSAASRVQLILDVTKD